MGVRGAEEAPSSITRLLQAYQTPQQSVGVILMAFRTQCFLVTSKDQHSFLAAVAPRGWQLLGCKEKAIVRKEDNRCPLSFQCPGHMPQNRKDKAGREAKIADLQLLRLRCPCCPLPLPLRQGPCLCPGGGHGVALVGSGQFSNRCQVVTCCVFILDIPLKPSVCFKKLILVL